MTPWQIGEWAILRPFWLFPALVLLLASWVWRQERVSSDWREVLSPALFNYLGADKRYLSHWNLPLLMAAMVALCLSQPAIRQSDDDTWRHSIGWIAVADVSRSMTLVDTVPSRLSAMRDALTELSRQAAARPIALILFSGDAFLVAPPAFDRSIFYEYTALLEHGVIPVEGSNLTRALSLASSVIDDSQLRKARVFVLGDSGGTGKSSIAAARFLAEAGHRVDMLVFGSSAIDSTRPGNNQETADIGDSWSQTRSATDETLVNEKQVRALADAGQGISVRANSFGVLDYDQLHLDRQSTASTHAELKSLVWRDQSHWLLLISLPLMVLLFRRETPC